MALSSVALLLPANHHASEITLANVCHWIQDNGRQPISWDTFIDTVRKAGLVTLADDIRRGLEIYSSYCVFNQIMQIYFVHVHTMIVCIQKQHCILHVLYCTLIVTNKYMAPK